MPGLAPAGEILSCDATRKYPKKRTPPPRPDCVRLPSLRKARRAGR